VALKVGQALGVEVASRNPSHSEVTAMPAGERVLRIDLPAWMLESSAGPERPRPALRDYLRYRNEQPDNLHATTRPEPLHRALCHAFNERGVFAGRRDAQVAVAREWIAQEVGGEFDAPYGIMAALILARHADIAANHEATVLVRILGRRALRSMHVEVLGTQWLGSEARSRCYGLWERLTELEGRIRRLGHEQDLKAIRQFCEAAVLHNDRSLLPIAAALSAAVGDLRRVSDLECDAPVTAALVRLYRTLPPGVPECGQDLHLAHKRELQELLARITAQALDITLLPDLGC
jgi:hypothetical protein